MGSSQRRNTDGSSEASRTANRSAGQRSCRTMRGRLLSSSSTATERVVNIVDAFEAVGACARGLMTRTDVDAIERAICPGAGACAGMFTANTMACAAEEVDTHGPPTLVGGRNHQPNGGSDLGVTRALSISRGPRGFGFALLSHTRRPCRRDG